MNHYPWLLPAYQQLVQPIENDRAHHALLLNYVEGSGEEILLSNFRQRLLCQTPQNNFACGQCHHCLLFKADNHPDSYIIDVEKDKHSISIAQIRQLIDKVYEHSQQGGNKVIWIRQATKMTEAAANALLKTLEEPPAHTYFILSDNEAYLLPATIRSRCFYFHLALPMFDSAVAWLKQRNSYDNENSYNDNQLATALLLNQSAPLAAEQLLVPEAWQAREVFCQSLMQSLSQNDYWSLLSVFNNNNNDPITYLNWFCLLLSDAIKAKRKAGLHIIYRDQVPLVRLLARNSEEKLFKLYQLWLSNRQLLVNIAGVNKELIIADLLLQSESI